MRHRWMGHEQMIMRDRPALTSKLADARQALGSAAVDAEMQGWSMSAEAAMEYALNDEA